MGRRTIPVLSGKLAALDVAISALGSRLAVMTRAYGRADGEAT